MNIVTVRLSHTKWWDRQTECHYCHCTDEIKCNEIQFPHMAFCSIIRHTSIYTSKSAAQDQGTVLALSVVGVICLPQGPNSDMVLFSGTGFELSSDRSVTLTYRAKRYTIDHQTAHVCCESQAWPDQNGWWVELRGASCSPAANTCWHLRPVTKGKGVAIKRICGSCG